MRTTRLITLLNCAYGANWIDAAVVHDVGDVAEFVKFMINGRQCIKNVLIACNYGGQDGPVTVSLGKSYWEYQFGHRNMAWTTCGLDNEGERGVDDKDFGVHIPPATMKQSDFDAFFKHVDMVEQDPMATWNTSSADDDQCDDGPRWAPRLLSE